MVWSPARSVQVKSHCTQKGGKPGQTVSPAARFRLLSPHLPVLLHLVAAVGVVVQHRRAHLAGLKLDRLARLAALDVKTQAALELLSEVQEEAVAGAWRVHVVHAVAARSLLLGWRRAHRLDVIDDHRRRPRHARRKL